MKYLPVFFCLLLPLSGLSQKNSALADPLTIDSLWIEGNRKTAAPLLLRELSVQPGDLVTTEDLPRLIEENENRLFSLGIFQHIETDIDTLSPHLISWRITVREQWFVIPELILQLADRNFNVWWTEQNHDFQRIILGTTLRHKNFRGKLEQLNITLQGGYTQKIGFEYIRPYMDKNLAHGLGIAFSFERSREAEYATVDNKLQYVRRFDRFLYNALKAELIYSYRPGYAARHFFKVGFEQYMTSDTVLALNPEYFLSQENSLKLFSLTYRLEYNGTDRWQYPLKGTKFIGQWINRIGLEGMQYQSMLTAEAGRYESLGGRWFGSSIFRGQLGSGNEQPYIFDRALTGKYNYVRGYEYYVVEGNAFGLLRLDLKFQLSDWAIDNIPFRYLSVIPIQIYPKIFTDGGYVSDFRSPGSTLNDRWMASAGVGIDIFTAYNIKMRFEYAWNLLGQKGLFLHFKSE